VLKYSGLLLKKPLTTRAQIITKGLIIVRTEQAVVQQNTREPGAQEILQLIQLALQVAITMSLPLVIRATVAPLAIQAPVAIQLSVSHLPTQKRRVTLQGVQLLAQGSAVAPLSIEDNLEIFKNCCIFAAIFT
jgi:hypothetical protein